jgi:hypothetical protein
LLPACLPGGVSACSVKQPSAADEDFFIDRGRQ